MKLILSKIELSVGVWSKILYSLSHSPYLLIIVYSEHLFQFTQFVLLTKITLVNLISISITITFQSAPLIMVVRLLAVPLHLRRLNSHLSVATLGFVPSR